MPCYEPITGYRTANGTVVFSELQRHGTTDSVTVACGQCIGCRLERSRVWATRCVHEANLYKHNSFITLTYNNENLPGRGQLQLRDMQLFMKRLRKKYEPKLIRFYAGGEYGTLEDRPHYHYILFNHDWTDKQYFKTTGSGEKIYTSKELEQLWPYGHSSTGAVTFESAAYIARYCIQKRNGEQAEEHYKRFDHMGEYQLTPEFNIMSRKPGIGGDWLKFYKGDVYTQDHIIINGVQTNVPKFYDKIFKRIDPEKMRDFKEEREYRGYLNRKDNTPERLAVKKQVAQAKINQLKREL